MKAVVLSFDRWQLGFLGCYGNEWIETPNMDRLASESVVFDQHFGENFDPGALNHAWWTGCYQFVRNHSHQQKLSPWMPALHATGVRTALIAESETGTIYDATRDGFEEVEEHSGVEVLFSAAREHVRGWHGVPAESRLLWVAAGGPELEGAAPEGYSDLYTEDLLERRALDDRFAENPLSEEFLDTEERYAEQVTHLDMQLGQLLEGLGEFPERGDLIFIVTAAQGGCFPERKAAFPDRPLLNDDLVHTPLIVYIPGLERAGSRRQALVQPVDIPATLLDWFGCGGKLDSVEGYSLLPLLHGELTAVRDFAFLGYGDRQWSARNEGFALIQDRREPDRGGTTSQQWLFVKPNDLWDTADAGAQYPESGEELEQALADFTARK